MVAVLLSTYNGEKYLSEQLQSLEDQDFLHWKLYIRDDGSTDKTIEIIRNFSNGRDNVEIIEDSNRNLGPALSFLKLLQHANAEYYMFCDQDDVWLPNKISACVHRIQEEEEFKSQALLVISDAEVVNDELKQVAPSFWKFNKFPPKLLLQNKDYINIYNSSPGCTMLFNDSLKNILPAKTASVLMHDWLVMIYALTQGKVLIENQPLIKYRQHNQNAVGAAKVGLIRKILFFVFNRKKQKTNEQNVNRFVNLYTGISKPRFYWLKFRFNILRYFSWYY